MPGGAPDALHARWRRRRRAVPSVGRSTHSFAHASSDLADESLTVRAD
jgi:hypothetical protein